MPSTIDHLGIYVPTEQFETVVEWYKKALAPLNYKELMRFPGTVGLGDKTPDFWISAKDKCAGNDLHYGFVSPGGLPLLPA